VHPHGLIDPAIPDSIEAMAAERLPAVRAVRPRGPYVLGGHCAGGMVALEIARQLMREGEEVYCVLMIDTVAPRPPKLVFPGVSVGADVQRLRRRSAAALPARDPPGSALALYRDVIRNIFRHRIRVASSCCVPRAIPTRVRQWVGPRSCQARRRSFVAGDHHTVITRHLDATAAQVRSCLRVPA
jgi:hypothetical protein